jgi:hypothetical protein
MRTSFQQYILAAGLFAITSCEKEIKVTLPQEPDKLVLNSSTKTGDTIEMIVSKSEGIMKYKHNKDLSVKDANVVLYENGTPIDTLKYDDASQKYISHTYATGGKTYSVKATAPGLGQAEGVCLVPSTVSIQSLQRNYKVRVDANGSEEDEVILQFDDPAGSKDYYIIQMHSPSDTFEQSYYCVNSTDPSVETVMSEDIGVNTCIPSNGIFMKDDLFNGKRKELRLYIGHYYMQADSSGAVPVYPTITLLHVTEDYFKYEKTYQFGVMNSGNPFSEPVNVHTNIKNGYGIFSIMSREQRELK